VAQAETLGKALRHVNIQSAGSIRKRGCEEGSLLCAWARASEEHPRVPTRGERHLDRNCACDGRDVVRDEIADLGYALPDIGRLG
jgi:hypothetical protein